MFDAKTGLLVLRGLFDDVADDGVALRRAADDLVEILLREGREVELGAFENGGSNVVDGFLILFVDAVLKLLHLGVKFLHKNFGASADTLSRLLLLIFSV